MFHCCLIGQAKGGKKWTNTRVEGFVSLKLCSNCTIKPIINVEAPMWSLLSDKSPRYKISRTNEINYILCLVTLLEKYSSTFRPLINVILFIRSFFFFFFLHDRLSHRLHDTFIRDFFFFFFLFSLRDQKIYSLMIFNWNLLRYHSC